MIRPTANRHFSAFCRLLFAALWITTSAPNAQAQTSYAVVHSFAGPPNDGSQPSEGLGVIQGSDGRLYGTTLEGGFSECFFPTGCGTVFTMAPDGTGYLVLHRFTVGEGAHPIAGLVQGLDGTLYGTTHDGPFGSIFQMGPDGSGFRVLHRFSGGPTDGTQPRASLTFGADGMLYGTTETGGLANLGTVFKIAADGSGFALLRSFTGGPLDGGDPTASLIQGSADGMLYGTTRGGGAASLGTVFQMSVDGSEFTLLHSFGGAPMDGAFPNASLLQDGDGTLYGTTREGGSPGCFPFANSCGTIFRLSPDGSGFTLLHSFSGQPDGGGPYAGLIQGTDGTLYGTTARSGGGNVGAVFKIGPDGSGLTILHSFTVFPVNDGYNPLAGVIQSPDGTLYGTAAYGGPAGFGVVFSLTPDTAASRFQPRLTTVAPPSMTCLFVTK